MFYHIINTHTRAHTEREREKEMLKEEGTSRFSIAIFCDEIQDYKRKRKGNRKIEEEIQPATTRTFEDAVSHRKMHRLIEHATRISMSR